MAIIQEILGSIAGAHTTLNANFAALNAELGQKEPALPARAAKELQFLRVSAGGALEWAPGQDARLGESTLFYQFAKSLNLNGGAQSVFTSLQSDVGTLQSFVFKRGPTGLYRWEFRSDANAESGGNAGSDLVLLRYDDAGGYLGEVLRVTRGANTWRMNATIGVGGNPSYPLDIYGAGESGIGLMLREAIGTRAAMRFGEGWIMGQGVTTEDRSWFVYDRGASTYLMVLTQTGYMGLGGLLDPNYPLDIAGGNDQYNSRFRVRESAHATSRRASMVLGTWVLGQDSGAHGVRDFFLYGGTGTPNFHLIVDVNGRLGVGTLPDTKLDVAGDLRLQPAASGAALDGVVYYDSSAQKFKFRQAGAWVELGGGSGAATWGSITGTLSSQTDLQSALNAKEPSLPSRTGNELRFLRVSAGGGLEWAVAATGTAWGSITGTLSSQTDLQSALNAKEPSLPSKTGNELKVLRVSAGGALEWATNSASVAWGGITGTLADQTDLNSALAGKEPSLPSKTGNAWRALVVNSSGDGVQWSPRKSFLVAYTNQTIAASTTRYHAPGTTVFGTSIVASFPVPFAMRVKRIMMRTITGTQSGTGSVVATLYKGGVATSMTATIPANAGAGNYWSSGNEVSFAADDNLCVVIVNNATATSINITFTVLEYEQED